MCKQMVILVVVTVSLMSLRQSAWALPNTSPPNGAATSAAPSSTQIPRQNWGSINPEDLPPLFSLEGLRSWLNSHHIRAYGWVDGGGYYASTGSGELELGFPIPNRFADSFIVNAAWIIVERPLPAHPEGWAWGFRADFYAGEDAALLRPLNSFGPQSARFGTDFRQAFVSVHVPLITSHGVDVQLGRQNVPIGYETLMGPYKPLYSATYYWIFHQVGSTGMFATLHANKRLDVVAGADLNYNTVFELRGRAPSYLGKAVFTPVTADSTTLVAAVYTGPKPVPTLVGHYGRWQTLTEVEVRHQWSPRVFQVAQGSYEWDLKDPGENNKTSVAQGAFSLATIHLTSHTLDLNLRGEWMHDPSGIRTHFPGTFGEATVGVNVMPVPWINLRPEVRGDFASSAVLGPVAAAAHKRDQLTAGGDLIFKF